MSASTQISIDEYLHTSFDGPDREYVDGESIERNMGEKKHSRVQFRITGLLYLFSQRQSLFGFTELRIKLAAGVVRIPDVCFFSEEPAERVPSTPPLCVIEIVSPDDAHSAVVSKLAEYAAFGVPHVWLIDPQVEKLYVYDAGSLVQTSTLTIETLGLQISSVDLFV